MKDQAELYTAVIARSLGAALLAAAMLFLAYPPATASNAAVLAARAAPAARLATHRLGKAVQLTSQGDNGATNWAPSWHPDGRHLVFASNMDDWHEDLAAFGHNFELYFMASDGSGLERLTDNDVFDSFAMFSPDGTKLAFASNRNPQKPRATDIYIADWIGEQR